MLRRVYHPQSTIDSCAETCSCPAWMQGTQHGLLQQIILTDCLHLTDECNVPSNTLVHTIQLFDLTKFRVISLNLIFNQTENASPPWFGSGEVTGITDYCTRFLCNTMGTRFCTTPHLKIAYIHTPTSQVPILVWSTNVITACSSILTIPRTFKYDLMVTCALADIKIRTTIFVFTGEELWEKKLSCETCNNLKCHYYLESHMLPVNQKNVLPYLMKENTHSVMKTYPIYEKYLSPDIDHLDMSSALRQYVCRNIDIYRQRGQIYKDSIMVTLRHNAEACILLQDHQQRPIGTMKIFAQPRFECIPTKGFTTRLVDLQIVSIQRCPGMGSCTKNACSALTEETKHIEFSAYNEFPGITRCQEACLWITCGYFCALAPASS
uniref:Phlebovirus_G2 domain-containing protein n=1 Tax=Heterorhabditis bacteriophora TaxID=37862 RepID=A0A1I7WGZ7_HETBA